MNWKKLRKRSQIEVDSSTMAWNIGIDLQVWATILASVAIAIIRPDIQVVQFALLLLAINVAVALGSIHKELLRWTIRQEAEIKLLKASLHEVNAKVLAMSVPASISNLQSKSNFQNGASRQAVDALADQVQPEVIYLESADGQKLLTDSPYPPSSILPTASLTAVPVKS